MTKHQEYRDNMFDLIDSDSLDTAELAKQLMLWLGTTELKRFVEVHEYHTIWTETQDEE
jgi:hypothetical protein